MHEPVDEANIFNVARKIESTDDRETYLQEACKDDEALRERVERLLSAYLAESHFLERPAPGLEDNSSTAKSGNVPDKPSKEGPDTGYTQVDSGRGEVDGSSVLKKLGLLLDLPHITLRESNTGGEDPVQWPHSPEIPERDADSRYRLDGEIARGGMGAIIKGHDTELGRELAIKVLLDEHKTNPAVIQRFVEEAQIGGQLQHPGIAPVYDFGQFGDQRPFFSMKLVRGQTLAALLTDRKDTTEDRARFLGIFEKICQTMAYAHSRGVIHRDLKPANIMVGAFGEVQVMDWGLAKVLLAGGVADEKRAMQQRYDETMIQTLRSTGSGSTDMPGSGNSETRTGSVMGTPAYMPPEQALGEIDNLDERTDVFGLGAILSVVLTGDPPYVGDNTGQIVRLASSGELNACFKRLDLCGADNELITLTKDCLELKKFDRPRNAGVLAARMANYLQSVENKLREAEVQRASESARAESEARRAQEERRRRRTSLAFAASLVLFLVLGSGSWLYIERRESNRQMIEAESQRRHAQAMENLAGERDQQRVAAENAKEKAQAAEEKSRRLLYSTDMQLAPFAWVDADTTVAQLRSRLDAHDPALNDELRDKEDLRGFEWYYQQHLLDRGSRVFGDQKSLFVDVVLTPVRDLITLDTAGDLKRWDSESRRSTTLLDLTGGQILQKAALAANGRWAAIAIENKIHVWDVTRGEEIFSVDSTPVSYTTLVFSGDSRVLVTVDDKIRWWNVENGELIHSTDSNSDSIRLNGDAPPIGLTGNGQTLAVGRFGRRPDELGNIWSILHLDSTAHTTERNDFDFGGSMSIVALSSDGLLLAVSSLFDGSLRIYESNGGRLLARNGSAHPSPISAMCFSPDGTQLITGSKAGSIKIWTAPEYLELSQTLKGHDAAVTKLWVSSDGKRLLSSSRDLTARIWDLNLSPFAAHEFANSALDATFSRDGLFIATAEGKHVVLRDATNGDTLRVLVNEGGPVISLALSLDNKLLACGQLSLENAGRDRRESHVTLWDIESGRRLADFSGVPLDHVAYTAAETLEFSPDGKFLAVGYGTGSSYYVNHAMPVTVWEIATARRRTLRGHKNTCVSIDFSPGSKTMATGSHDGTTRLWDTETWEPIGKPLQHKSARAVDCVAFSVDGKLLATGDTNSNVVLWDVQTREPLRSLSGHSNSVLSLSFSPDGRTLASGGNDDTIRLWNTDTWLELMSLNSPTPLSPQRLEFSRDGRQLLAASNRVVTWTTRAPVWADSENTSQLSLLLGSEDDFRSRVRMFSAKAALHNALTVLHDQRPNDERITIALTAVRTVRQASREDFDAAADAYDQLNQLTQGKPHEWLGYNELTQLAEALKKAGRHADAANLLELAAGLSENNSSDNSATAHRYMQNAMTERVKRLNTRDNIPAWLVLDGHTFLATPHIPFDQYDSFTVEAWVMDWYGPLIQQGKPVDPENSVYLKLGSVAGWESGPGKNHENRFDAPSPEQWNHVAIVFDSVNLTLFLNGNIVHQRAAPRPGPLTSTRSMFIGAQTELQGPLATSRGLLASLRMSRSAKYTDSFDPEDHLEASEDTILLYDSRYQQLPGLMRDISGNGRHARIHGSPLFFTSDQSSPRAPVPAKDFLLELNELITENPENSMLYAVRAKAHSSLGNWEDAVNDYSHTLENETIDPRLLAARAEAYIHLGLWKSAATDMQALFDSNSHLSSTLEFARDFALLQLVIDNKDIYRKTLAKVLRRLDPNLDAEEARWLVELFTACPAMINDQNRGQLIDASRKGDPKSMPRLNAALVLREGGTQVDFDKLAQHEGSLHLLFIAAIAHHQIGDTDRARELHAEASIWIEEQRQRDPENPIPAGLAWQEWVINVALQREADAIINGTE